MLSIEKENKIYFLSQSLIFLSEQLKLYFLLANIESFFPV